MFFVRCTSAADLTCNTAIQNRNRLHSQVLAHLEILIKTKSVSHHIRLRCRRIPYVYHFLTLRHITDCIFPVPSRIHRLSLNGTTSRKTQEFRMHCLKLFHQILTQAVSFVCILRHKRYHIYIKVTVACICNNKSAAVTFKFFVCSECNRILFPIVF